MEELRLLYFAYHREDRHIFQICINKDGDTQHIALYEASKYYPCVIDRQIERGEASCLRGTVVY